VSDPKLRPGTNHCLCSACGEYFTCDKNFQLHRSGRGSNRRCVNPSSIVDKRGIARLRRNDRGLWATADKIVALGVVVEYPLRYELNKVAIFTSPKSLVRDWRVAGALMEKIEAEGYDFIADVQAGRQPIIRTGRWNGERCSTENTKGVGKNKSLPRAIIEACVEALN